MPQPEKLSFDDAIVELCSKEWVTAQSGTRRQEEVLLALLPASRNQEGRLALGASPGAIKNLCAVLNEPLIFLEDVGSVAVRLLRNLCARSHPNQLRAAEAAAHLRVFECIERRLEFYDDGTNGDIHQMPAAMRRVEDGIDGEDHSRLRMPFFGFAVEFLCNFVTCNAQNAALVWNRAFPKLFSKLLECDNRAASSAAAALVHNCIAVLPERMSDIVKIWQDSEGEGRSLAQSLLQQVRIPDDGDNAEEFEKFSWSYLVIKRLIEAGLLGEAFKALGPPLQDVLKDTEVDFSSDQETLLGVLEAAIGKSAEIPTRESDTDITVPEESLPFFSELLEVSLQKRNGNVLRLTLSTTGSIIILCSESSKLTSLKITCIKAAVERLKQLTQSAHATESSKSMQTSGLRASAIRAIALSCDRYRAGQELVRDLEGIPLVLNALSYEKDPAVNPFLREWAIIAVRNLCLDNEQNANEISSYELHDISKDNEFLQRAGLEAFVDDTSGQRRVRIRQTQSV